MALYNFDSVNRIIQLTSTGELDMNDLYSRWKDAVLTTIPDAVQALRVIKEPLSGSTFVGPFYFLMNDWQICPVDTPHELVIDGTLVQDVTSTKNVLKLDGLFNAVSVNRLVATEVRTVELGTSGLTPDESNQLASISNIPQDVWNDTSVNAPGTKGGDLNKIKKRTSLIPANL